MSKVDTDQGLGPGSEPRRRELLGIQDEGPGKDRDAETQPGVGKVERRPDVVDKVLDGFGRERPDVPRILPPQETTPPPDPVKEIPSTEPGKRQRVRTMVLATVISFGLITAFGVGVVKLATNNSTAAPPPTTPVTTTASTSPSTIPVADTATDLAPAPTITTMQVDSLPTASKASHPVGTGRPVHSATSATPPVTATHPTGSAPPGMGLLPDDPHR